MAISKSGLPQKVLELFDPRADLEFKPPIDKKKPVLPLLGLAGYVGHFPGPDDPDFQPQRPELATSENRKFRSKEYSTQVWIGEPSILERRDARTAQHSAQHAAQLETALAAFDPKSDPNTGESDPMKTLFVSRLDYSVTEADLYAEFEKHGSIKSLRLIRDSNKKSCGYAFIEYQHTGDMKVAYKAYPPDGFVRLGSSSRWSVVDVERGRTVPDWRPMRLGGGKGGEGRRARPKQDKQQAAARLPGALAGPPVEQRMPGPPPGVPDAARRYPPAAHEAPRPARPDRGTENGQAGTNARSSTDRYSARDDRYSSRDSGRSHSVRDDRRHSERDRDGDRRTDVRGSYGERAGGYADRGRDRNVDTRPTYGDRSHSHGSGRDERYAKRDRGDGYERTERRGDDRDSKRGRYDERERYSSRDRHAYRA